ncbi:carbohydrate ABC transporter permease [Paenibacillus eucommiae]|uniref:ABC-type glycerol-3-phosphate transport system permease component n=1 Tax=Paenibacillus eucommiae TaxID=1355755 RepID=A0ABS4ILZ9_9BACL|nr:carbohydrate ABC transporter permease [Paenibacillus eucommiae]MBP1988596.1 ABC-type glycerol-3-phosphate transport system permease component [Paenibacillus eucommiae]
MKSAVSYGTLVVLLLLSFIPIFMMISMSLRDSLMIYGDFWSLPWPPKWENYSFALIDLTVPILRTIYLCVISIVGIMIFATLSGYAFARLTFVGRNMLFFIVVLMMTVPGVLLLTPNFILADFLHLKNSLEGLAVFYIGGGQLFAIFLLSTFFQSQPEEMFEAARMEGASEFRCVWAIAIPLARPILITIGIMNFLSIYNDLIWPILLISTPNLQTISMALANYAPNAGNAVGQMSRPDLGIITSGYAFASIPLLFLFTFGMRYFIEGLTSGSVKA